MAAHSDPWVGEYDGAKELCNDTLGLIQERNIKYADGGPDASRITAAARRKLGTLGTLIDNLRTSLETPQYADLSENEKNRRRDLLTALRSRREQMLQALKRDQPRSNSRTSLLGDANKSSSSLARETDITAERTNQGLVQLQQQVMRQQDTELDSLEHSVNRTKHIALQINEETGLQNRLLDDLETDVDVTSDRIKMAQRKLKVVLRRASSCKTQLLVFLTMAALILVLIIGFKIAIHIL